MSPRPRQIIRQLDQETSRSRDAARELVGRIVTCYVSAPDLYDVKAAVITRSKTRLLLVRLAWTDDAYPAYYLDGDPWAVVQDIVDLPDFPTGREAAERWIGDSIREVPFKLLPGLLQEAYAAAVIKPRPPPDALGYLWVVPWGDEDNDWPVRIFPSGIGKNAPPIGEVAYVAMPRVAIEEMWRLRGW
jgi:hypothetical protein